MPSTPTLAGTCLTGSPYGLAASGNYVYVADGPYGLKVVSVAFPNSPSVVGSCDIPGRAENVEIYGNYAYVSSLYAGVTVVDISSPANPLVVGYSDTPGMTLNIFPDGDFVYAASGIANIQILRAFDPCINITVAPDGTSLTGQVPSGLPPGAHDLHVVNPDGERAILKNSFTVRSGSFSPAGVFLLLFGM